MNKANIWVWGKQHTSWLYGGTAAGDGSGVGSWAGCSDHLLNGNGDEFYARKVCSLLQRSFKRQGLSCGSKQWYCANIFPYHGKRWSERSWKGRYESRQQRCVLCPDHPHSQLVHAELGELAVIWGCWRPYSTLPPLVSPFPSRFRPGLQGRGTVPVLGKHAESRLGCLLPSPAGSLSRYRPDMRSSSGPSSQKLCRPYGRRDSTAFVLVVYLQHYSKAFVLASIYEGLAIEVESWKAQNLLGLWAKASRKPHTIICWRSSCSFSKGGFFWLLTWEGSAVAAGRLSRLNRNAPVVCKKPWDTSLKGQERSYNGISSLAESAPPKM